MSFTQRVKRAIAVSRTYVRRRDREPGIFDEEAVSSRGRARENHAR